VSDLAASYGAPDETPTIDQLSAIHRAVAGGTMLPPAVRDALADEVRVMIDAGDRQYRLADVRPGEPVRVFVREVQP